MGTKPLSRQNGRFSIPPRFCEHCAVNGREHDPLEERTARPGQPAVVTSASPTAGLLALAGTMGNRAFATAALSRRPASGRSAVVARQGPGHDAPPPIPPQTRAVAEKQISPEVDAVAAELRASTPPTLEHLRRLRTRVATARGLFDTVPAPAGGLPADNWSEAIASTAIGRTLLDGLLFPGSDAELRLSWGKALGTCRQLVGLLREGASAQSAGTPEPAPSPNPLPPPPPPPIGGEPAAPAPSPPDVAMETDICPRIEAAIGEISRMVASDTVEEIEVVRARYADLPERIDTVAKGQEFGPVAALEFQKGLELVKQATLAPPEQLAQIADALEDAADLTANLDAAPEARPPSEATPAPGPGPNVAPSPNPLPPPPPPPITP
jgi:hypothetical protein